MVFDIFFVYGTLKHGESRGGLWEEILGDSYYVLPATIKGDMYDLGFYPAVIEGEGVIKGEAICVPSDMSIQVRDLLDRVEGYRGPDSPYNLYNRIEVEIFTEADVFTGTTYFYACPDRLRYMEHIPSGEWSRSFCF